MIKLNSLRVKLTAFFLIPVVFISRRCLRADRNDDQKGSAVAGPFALQKRKLSYMMEQ